MANPAPMIRLVSDTARLESVGKLHSRRSPRREAGPAAPLCRPGTYLQLAPEHPIAAYGGRPETENMGRGLQPNRPSSRTDQLAEQAVCVDGRSHGNGVAKVDERGRSPSCVGSSPTHCRLSGTA